MQDWPPNEKINREFALLDSIIKEKAPEIIIWGCTPICRQFLSMYGDYYPPSSLTVWDRKAKEGPTFDGYDVTEPRPEELPDEFKENGYILLALLREVSYRECEAMLINHGVKNIINGADFRIYWKNKIIGNQYNEYQRMNTDHNFLLNPDDLYVFDFDMFASAGKSLNDDYLLQDLWGARKVYDNKPAIHYDIGSRVDGFVTHILSFRTKVVLIDIRPLAAHSLEDLTFICSDATNLAELGDESVESLSALCSLEHFGLGRYGDTIDPEAHRKAFSSIQRVMKPKGNVYISLPIAASPRLVFNAHRIYTPKLVCQYFDRMELAEFSYTSPQGLVKNTTINEFMNHVSEIEVYRNNERELYVTGLFHFVKK